MSFALAQGLQFTGGHHPIEERSSLEIFHRDQISFNDNFEISFDLKLPVDYPIGYILRIKSEEDSKIFNLHYDKEDGKAVFRLNEEGKASLITARVKNEFLLDKRWFPLRIHFDLAHDRISLFINNQELTTDYIDLPDHYSPLITFGKSDYLIDVLSIAIRNLSVGNNQISFRFPLREHTGETVHDENGRILGRVSNPTWLINDSYHWKKLGNYASATEAGADYSEARKEIYYFNRDSLRVHNLRTNESKTIQFSKPCPVKLVLGNSFIDDLNSRLYVYETHYDSLYNGPTIASLDLINYTWKIENHHLLSSELHHHSFFFDPERKAFTIFGGYGNMAYSSQFYTYDLNEASWKEENGYQGDAIIPRYFGSAGMSADNSRVYFFGGMGNEAGKHIVGRKYFYDLHVLDLNKKQIKKRWELEWKKPNIVPARGIIVPDSNDMFVLGYPEHLTNSYIKLYRFALKNGQYEILGDSIPIYSDRISTRAKLYYDRDLNQLLTLVQESPNDVSSTLTLYALNFPPISAAELSYMPYGQKFNWGYLLGGAILLVIGSAIAMRHYRRKNNLIADNSHLRELQSDKSKTIDTSHDIRRNSIFLFGDFMVIDRHGKDITHLFSSQLKQTLCLLLSHIESGGISSKLLSHTLWPYKAKEKVKTSRGVTLNNLRKIIAELDGVEVIYEKGHFCLIMTEESYCDYNECLKLISEGKVDNNQEFINIVSRGKFLLGEDHAMFDAIKDDIEFKITPILLQELQNQHQKHQYLKTIRIADLLFELDPTNEQALAYSIKAMMALKLETKAKTTYKLFLAEYQQLMGESFPYSFEELRKNDFS